jgi:hypothetical protein
LTIRSKARSSAGWANETEIGKRVADLGPLVKAKAADNLVRKPDRNESFLELAGLELGPDEDCSVVERAAATLMRFDLLTDAAGPPPVRPTRR